MAITCMRAAALGALLFLGSAAPALAQSNTVVFGSTEAQSCYQEARFGLAVSTGLRACDAALKQETLTRSDYVATLVNRGILYNRGKRYDLALADFGEAIRLDPNSGEAFLNRGNSHYFSKRFDAALSDYNRAIELETRDLHAAHFNRGLVLETKGRIEEALAAYRTCLALRADFLPAAARAEQLEAKIESDT